MKRTLLSFSFVFFTTTLIAQIAGESTFSILDFSTSARTIAMGGELMSVHDNDVNLAESNPALLNSKMNRQISFSFVDYFSDINAVFFENFFK